MAVDVSQNAIFSGATGEMADRLKTHDWGATCLGEPSSWPENLHTILAVCVDSHFPIAVWWGPELIQFYNDAYRPILGASKHPGAFGSPARATWREIWHTIGPMVDQVTVGGETVSGEDMRLYLTRNGYEELCYFSFSYSPVRDRNGAPVGMFTAAVETTSKVLAERRQAFQIRLYDRIRGLAEPQSIIDAACMLLGEHMQVVRVGYSDVDAAANRLHVKQCWTDGTMASTKGMELPLDKLGLAIASELRNGLSIPLDDVNIDKRCIDSRETFAALGMASMLLVPLLRDGALQAVLSLGATRPRRWRPEEIRLAEDTAKRTQSAIERANAELALRRQLMSERDRLNMLLDKAPSFMALLSGPRHIFEMTNLAFRDLIRDRDVLGKTIREALPEAETLGFVAILDRVFKSGQTYSVTDLPLPVRNPATNSIGTRYVELVYQPVTTIEGKVSGIFIEGYDVTKRKQAIDALQDADRRKDEFLAMLAHELRNPLAPISTASELMRRTELTGPALRRTSEIISRQVNHMTELIDDLLDVSRVTRGIIVLDKSLQNIQTIIASAIEQVRPAMEANRHHLTIHMSADPAQVEGDQKRLVQILTNLLMNSVKYTAEQGAIEIRLNSSQTHVTVEVSDNGIGIPAGLQPRVFDLFAQAERTPDRAQGGLGLGLALVKSLVELHGGSVACESAGPGQGSKFTVSLPRTEVAGGTEDRLPFHDTIDRASRTLRVMIVDDNEDASETMAMYLREAGHKVSVENDSRRAFERAKAEKPQVMLIDIGMPDIDGHKLAAMLRADIGMSKRLLIAVTGYGGEQDRRASIAAGFDHHLVKPISPSSLADIMAAYASGSATQ
jgi:signal transduction histidine kinase/ActR/RegA family two-component response regulator